MTDDNVSASTRGGSRRAAQTRRNPRAKHVRTRTGCWNCRRKRKKCELAHRSYVIATLSPAQSERTQPYIHKP